MPRSEPCVVLLVDNAEGIDGVVLDLIDAGHVERGGLNRVIDGVGRAHVGDDLVFDTPSIVPSFLSAISM